MGKEKQNLVSGLLGGGGAEGEDLFLLK